MIKKLIVVSSLERFAASLSRIWQHATQDKFPCGIITAFRGPRQIQELKGKIRAFEPRYSKNENISRNLRLQYDMAYFNLRWITTHGAYIEGFRTPQAVEVKEDSFFVEGLNMSFEQLKKILMDLGARYQQDSILIIDPSDHYAYSVGTQDTNEEGDKVEPGKGIVEPQGVFHPNQIGPLYSKWKGHKFEFRANSSIDSLYGKSLAQFQASLACERSKKGVKS